MPAYFPRLRIAAYVMCEDGDGRVLLARWIGHGSPQWTLVGGGLEPGEHPQAGALRELTEETGYVGEIDALLGVDVQHGIGNAEPPAGYDAIAFDAVRIVFRGRIVGGELTYEVDGTTDLAAWVPRAEIADLDAVSLVGAGMAMLDGPGAPMAPPPSSPDLVPDGTATALAAYGVARRAGGDVLLIRSRDEAPGRWVLPGGGVEHGQDPAAVVARTFREQTGLGVRVEAARAATSDIEIDGDGAGVWTVRLAYDVVIVGDETPADDGDGPAGGPRWIPEDAVTDVDAMPFVAEMLAG